VRFKLVSSGKLLAQIEAPLLQGKTLGGRGDVVGGEDRRGCALRGELGHRVPVDAGGYVLQRRGLRGCGAGPRRSPGSISPVMSVNKEGRRGPEQRETKREREREKILIKNV